MRLLCLLFFFASLGVGAQRTLRGTVVDDGNGAPLCFVNVYLAGDPTHGVLTNVLGEYQLAIPSDTLREEVLFSMLSYTTYRQPLWRLGPGQKPLVVRLQTSFIDLGEVVVISDIGLRALVKRTFEAIPDNYGTDDYLLQAYYRKFDIDDGEYTQVLEATLSIRDTKYGPEMKEPKAWINQFRSSSYTGPELNFYWPEINVQNSLHWAYCGRSNFARAGVNAYTGSPMFVSPEAAEDWMNRERKEDDFMPHLTFSNRGEYLSGTDTLVRIAYQIDPGISGLSVEGSAESWNRGELLISKGDLAILRLRHGNTDNGSFYDVQYHKVGGKYYFKSAQEIIQYDYAAEMRHHFSSRYLYVTEVITDRRAIKQTKKGKRVLPELPLADVAVPYDLAFWETNEMMQTIPAPEAMRLELSRMQAFKQSFLENARRVKQ